MQELIDKVVEIVNSKQGVKCPDLAIALILELRKKSKDQAQIGWDARRAIEAAVEQGKIFEIEYCLPNMPDRVKSFYLPAKTEIKLVNYRDPNSPNKAPVRPTHIDHAGGQFNVEERYITKKDRGII